MFECFNAGVVQACIGEGRWQHTHKQFANWTAAEVSTWTRAIGPAFADFAQRLSDHGIDGIGLLHLGKSDLIDSMVRACYSQKRYIR